MFREKKPTFPPPAIPWKKIKQTKQQQKKNKWTYLIFTLIKNKKIIDNDKS